MADFIGPHLSRTLQALRTRNLEAASDRGPSHILLCFEHLRRLALWTTSVGVLLRWWQPYIMRWYRAEIGRALNPHIQIPQWLESELNSLLGRNDEDLLTIYYDVIYWALARDQFDFAAHYHLPDPYEPLLMMLQRGAYFYVSHPMMGENFVIEAGSSYFLIYQEPDYRLSRRFTKETVRHTSYVELNDAILDAIDAPLRLGLDFVNHDDATYKEASHSYHDYLIYSFQE